MRHLFTLQPSIQLVQPQGECFGRDEPTHSGGWGTLHAGPPAERWSAVSSLVPPQDADCGQSGKLVAASSPAQQLPCPTCAALNRSKSRWDKYINHKEFWSYFFLNVCCCAADRELLDLQLVLVQLVAEEVVLPVELVDALPVLLGHLCAGLHLRPEGIDLPLSVNQPQRQSLLVCMQGLPLLLDLFQPGKMLQEEDKKKFNKQKHKSGKAILMIILCVYTIELESVTHLWSFKTIATKTCVPVTCWFCCCIRWTSLFFFPRSSWNFNSSCSFCFSSAWRDVFSSPSRQSCFLVALNFPLRTLTSSWRSRRWSSELWTINHEWGKWDTQKHYNWSRV